METPLNMSEFGLLHWPYEDPQQFESFWFEKIDANKLRFWAKRNLSTCGYICSIYFLFVWLGPKWMKNRQPYHLNKPLAFWNFFLSLFSLAVVVRILPELMLRLSQRDGFYRSLCVAEGLNYPSSFWGFLFVISKVVELGDTIFIVLRKKPLIFLHSFHHFNMVWSTFFLFVEGEPFVRWPVIVNSSIHTIMYAYYGLRALQIKVPRQISMTITSLQIMQFVFGLIVQCYQLLYYTAGRGRPCIRTQSSIIISTIFGFSYLFLFVNLFYRSYIVNEKPKSA